MTERVFAETPRDIEDIKLMGEALAFIAEAGLCTVQIRATVNNTVRYDHLRITDAAPDVVEAVIEHFRFVSVHDGGLLVNVRDVRKPPKTGN
jgi:hypothetical protein